MSRGLLTRSVLPLCVYKTVHVSGAAAFNCFDPQIKGGAVLAGCHGGVEHQWPSLGSRLATLQLTVWVRHGRRPGVSALTPSHQVTVVYPHIALATRATQPPASPGFCERGDDCISTCLTRLGNATPQYQRSALVYALRGKIVSGRSVRGRLGFWHSFTAGPAHTGFNNCRTVYVLYVYHSHSHLTGIEVFTITLNGQSILPPPLLSSMLLQ